VSIEVMDFGTRVHALRTAEPLHDRWWLTLLVPYVVQAVLAWVLLTAPLVPASAVPAGPTLPVLPALLVASLLLSIPGLYFDMLYVAEVSEWRPSMWYSLMLFTPYVGWLILVVYLLRRWKYVGLW
jgi:hypothetical protein